jgi:hypothetical protein
MAEFIAGGYIGTDPEEPAITFVVPAAGGIVSNRLTADGSIVTNLLNHTSFECVDDNTARYISSGWSYPSNKPIPPACGLAFTNATHRRFTTAPLAGGVCPDSFPEDGQLVGLDHRLTSFEARRIEGVVERTVTKCRDVAAAPAAAPAPPGAPPAVSPMGAALPEPGAGAVETGVWARSGTLMIRSPTAFGAARWLDGQLVAKLGPFGGHQCVNATHFYATLGDTTYALADPQTAQSYFLLCEEGVRGEETLTVRWTTQGPCPGVFAEGAGAPIVGELAMELVEPLPGGATAAECFAGAPTAAALPGGAAAEAAGEAASGASELSVGAGAAIAIAIAALAA